MKEYIFGRQTIWECLRGGRRERFQVRIMRGIRPAPIVRAILEAARASGVPVREAEKSDLDRAVQGGHHQGLVLEAGPYPYRSESDLWAEAERSGETPFFLVLDHVQDPQNVGSLLRSADAAGVHGVILPRDRAAGVTPAVVRASSGASEHVCVVQVANVAQALERVKKKGVWVCGLDADPVATVYTEEPLLGEAVALVVGNEGEGLARLTRDRCDVRVRLPMRGRVQSLNAAVSGAIALYEVRRRRPQKGVR